VAVVVRVFDGGPAAVAAMASPPARERRNCFKLVIGLSYPHRVGLKPLAKEARGQTPSPAFLRPALSVPQEPEKSLDREFEEVPIKDNLEVSRVLHIKTDIIRTSRQHEAISRIIPAGRVGGDGLKVIAVPNATHRMAAMTEGCSASWSDFFIRVEMIKVSLTQNKV
jgi:hypothetical protein